VTQQHIQRASPSPYIDRVWRTFNLEDGVYLATPDGCWDLIFYTSADGSRGAMLAGQATKSAYVPYNKGSDSVVISFAAGVYMPQLSGDKMLDLAELLPMSDDEHFGLAGELFAVPTYETAEQLVEELAAKHIIKIDEVVAAVLAGTPKALSDRVMQRHFHKVTGMSKKGLEQIHRAQEAVRILQAGKPPREAAADAGYADQAHMAKSLKKLMDSKPSDTKHIHKL